MSDHYVSFPYASELEAHQHEPALSLPKLLKAFFSTTVNTAAPVPAPSSGGSRTLVADDERRDEPRAAKKRSHSSKSTDKDVKVPRPEKERFVRPYRLSTIAPPSVRLTHATGSRVDLAASTSSARQMPLPRDLYFSPRASVSSDTHSVAGSPTVPDSAHAQSFPHNFSTIPGFPLSRDILVDDAQSVSSIGGGSKAAEGSNVSMMFRRLRGEGLSRDYWMDDASAAACFDCDSTFTALRRKHHCRFRCLVLRTNAYCHAGRLCVSH
jgi:hypothetical protein